MKKIITLLILALFAVMIACSDDPNENGNGEEQPQFRSETITLFGGSHFATVEGTMLQEQWEGVANTIAARLNAEFDEWEENRDRMKEIFDRGVTYIVEVNPEGYTRLKTTGDGKTIYIALSQVDTAFVLDGMVSIYTNETTIVKNVKYNTVNLAQNNCL